MATVKISAWEIAEMLGLRYLGEEYDEHKCYYVYKFRFHDKFIGDETWHETEEEAKESMAEKILMQLGEKLAGMIE